MTRVAYALPCSASTRFEREIHSTWTQRKERFALGSKDPDSLQMIQIFAPSSNGPMIFDARAFTAMPSPVLRLLLESTAVRSLRKILSGFGVFIFTGCQGVGNLSITPNPTIVMEYLTCKVTEQKQVALKALEYSLKAQYSRILRAYHKRRVTIRLFDTNMANFVPSNDDEAAMVGSSMNLAVSDIKTAMYRIKDLYVAGTSNSVLNTILFPDLVAAQLTALFDAIIFVRNEGTHVYTTLSLTMVMNEREMAQINTIVDGCMRTVSIDQRCMLRLTWLGDGACWSAIHRQGQSAAR